MWHQVVGSPAIRHGSPHDCNLYEDQEHMKDLQHQRGDCFTAFSHDKHCMYWISEDQTGGSFFFICMKSECHILPVNNYISYLFQQTIQIKQY